MNQVRSRIGADIDSVRLNVRLLISMDENVVWRDNARIERFCRSIKYEAINPGAGVNASERSLSRRKSCNL